MSSEVIRALIPICILTPPNVKNNPIQWSVVTATRLCLYPRHAEGKGIPFSNSQEANKQVLWAQSSRRVLLLRALVTKLLVLRWPNGILWLCRTLNLATLLKFEKQRVKRFLSIHWMSEIQLWCICPGSLTCFFGADGNSQQELCLFIVPGVDIIFTAVTAGDPGQVVLYHGEFWTSTRRGCELLLIAISMIKGKKMPVLWSPFYINTRT